MILVYNCVVGTEAAARYEKNLVKKIITDKQIVLTGPGKAQKDMKGRDFTHLIISGSAASATETNPWDGELSSVIDIFFKANKAILGICYGHQFLASWFLGKSCLFQMEKPEYGWNKIGLKPNPLFKNVTSDIFCHIHSDSVRILPEECIIIAENETGIQGFQYKEKNVFGVQFHPDYNHKEAKALYELRSAANPRIKEAYKNKIPGENTDKDGARILSNFIKM